MKGILKDINLSSSGYKESSGGLNGKANPLQTASLGILSCFNCSKHVLHSHSLFFVDILPVKHLCFSSLFTDDNREETATTECENHVWWQHVQTKIGPSATYAIKRAMQCSRSSGFVISFFGDVSNASIASLLLIEFFLCIVTEDRRIHSLRLIWFRLVIVVVVKLFLANEIISSLIYLVLWISTLVVFVSDIFGGFCWS